ITVVTDNSQKVKPKEVEPKPKAQPKIAQVKSTSQIKIVDDSQEADVANQMQISPAIISDQTVDGLPSVEIVTIKDNSNKGNENPKITGEAVEGKVFLSSSDAQYPGGKEAFAAFLRKSLVTPDELETGEKRSVLVRFMVDID